jgi:D-alanyl-D-alanine dipeptidase
MKWDRSKGRPEPIRALNRIREIENREPLVDLRDAAPTAVIGRESTIPFVRATVAQMVEKAAKSLPCGVRLSITDAFRPFIRQQKISQWIEACISEAYPAISRAALRRRACRWVAPVDQKAPPGHCTGAAVDVVLLGDNGEALDVTSPFNRFAAGPTYVFGLTEEAQRNRDLLVATMLEAGFSNCRDEYWHYSYGDAGWAVRMGLDSCFYGLVELDPVHWKAKQRAWEMAMADRPNPFLEPPLASEAAQSSSDQEMSHQDETNPD